MDYGDFEEVRKYRVERNKILSAYFIFIYKFFCKIRLSEKVNSTVKLIGVYTLLYFAL